MAMWSAQGGGEREGIAVISLIDFNCKKISMNDTREFLGQAHCGNGATRLILLPCRQHLQVHNEEEKNK